MCINYHCFKIKKIKFIDKIPVFIMAISLYIKQGDKGACLAWDFLLIVLKEIFLSNTIMKGNNSFMQSCQG